MNFDFSDEQKALQAEARRFLDARCPAQTVRAVLDDDSLAHDAHLWRAVCEQGWSGAGIAEEFGGVGLGPLEQCLLAEELGRSLAPVPFASTVYVLAEAIKLAGTEGQKQRLLPGIVSGQIIGALAKSEPLRSAGSAPGHARVDGNRLSGIKQPVVDGLIATTAIVTAEENGQPGLFLVDLDAPEVSRTPLRTLDPTRGAATIRFEGVPCERLGEAGDGERLLRDILDRAAVFVAFEQLGGADRCLEMAKGYALERHAFGRAIGSYQAIKHKLADIYVKNELARSHAYYGAWALSAGSDQLRLAASAARIAASDAYWHAAKESIQTHGGIGFTWEMDCHLFYRRSRHLARYFSDSLLIASRPKRFTAWLSCFS